ncbi:MAG: T9SS type A sorting domain-containing protein, partial [Chitinophagaceae bacterium]
TTGPGLISLAPNPFAGRLSLRYRAASAEKVSIELIDVSGRVVKKANVSATAGDNTFYLQGSELPSGIYFVRIKAGSVVITEKLRKE